MRLQDFETNFDDAIVKRGYDYYKRGHVLSLEEDGSEWLAEVDGSEVYSVTAVVSDSLEIVHTTCDCPYDLGEYCKHQAAVFFAIRDKKKGADDKKKPRQKAPKQNLADVLGNLDKPELISILLGYAEQHKHIKEELLFKYSENSDVVGQARRLIKSAVHSVKRRGYVEYRDTCSATDGADKVLELAEALKGKGELLNCAKLCVTVLEEMMDLLDYCDDSDGYVGGIIESTMNLLNELTYAGGNRHTDAEKLFDIISLHAHDKIYDGWSEWQLMLLDACVPLCEDTKLRKRLEEYLSDLQSHDKKDDFDSRYMRKAVQRITYGLISRFNGQECADTYIELHVENSDFREIAIRKAIEYSDLERALALCLDGEQIDAQYAGLVSNWKKLRYVVYESQNDYDAQKKLATEFTLDGSMEFYHKLKALYPAEEWSAVLQTLLEKMEQGRARHTTYIEILIQEGLKSKLLAYCRQMPSSVTRLYSHLLPEFQMELDEIFKDYILQGTVNASSRSHYHNICGIIKHYAKACGKQSANAIKEELMAKYPRRPAFLDELIKMKV